MKLFSRILGQGKDFIILHGLYGSGDNWLTIAKRLSDNYKVHLIDQRNHGNSQHSNIHTYELMVADLQEYIQINEIATPVILGHSMGGKTAIWNSIMYPDQASAYIIVDISPGGYSHLLSPSPIIEQHLNIMNGIRMVDLDEASTRTEVDKLLSQYIPDGKIRQFLLKNVDRDSEGKFSWKININALSEYLPEIMRGVDVIKQAGKINHATPVLFIKGANSHYIEEKDIQIIQSAYPQAKIETIPQAGHWVHAEQPELFLKCIQNFLQSV